MKREQYWKRLIQYIFKDCVTHFNIIMSATCFGPFVPSSGFMYTHTHTYIYMCVCVCVCVYKLKLKVKLQYTDTIPYSQLLCVYSIPFVCLCVL